MLWLLCTVASAANIAVYKQDPIADTECAEAIAKVLRTQHHVVLLDHTHLTHANLSNINVLVFPGGLGDVDEFDDVLLDKKTVVQQYFASGRVYMGICMGAYIAGQKYFDLVNDIKIHRYINRPHNQVETDEPCIVKCNWQQRLRYMYFFDGPVFLGNIKQHEKIATYSNGDAAAIIKHTRTGVFVGIGPHPESQSDWYESKNQRYWHQGDQHALIRDVLNQALKSTKSSIK